MTKIYHWFTCQIFSEMDKNRTARQPQWSRVVPINMDDDEFTDLLIDFFEKIEGVRMRK